MPESTATSSSRTHSKQTQVSSKSPQPSVHPRSSAETDRLGRTYSVSCYGGPRANAIAAAAGVLAVAVAVFGLASSGLAAPRVGAVAATTTALDVQPFPGTPDASPQTEVGFPALAVRQISSLRVIGSRSGLHAGRMVELPGGGGAAFVPSRPFVAGERVAVHAILSSSAAGTASGAPGATRLSFGFTVAIAVPGAQALSARATGLLTPTASIASAGLTHSFHSEPWLHPAVVAISGRDPDPGKGDIFTNPEELTQHGPMILSPQGQLIYFRPTHWRVFNVQVQDYQGQSVLTYWLGSTVSVGCDLVLNHHYRQIASVCAGNGDSADAHEFQITPQGNALISAYAPVKADLSSIGGPRDGTLMDSIIQEINVATGQVIWEWHASGHVALNSTQAGTPGTEPYDFFHINSIQQLPGDKLLVSGRNTWALYEIDMRTGRVLLVIGGNHSDFRLGPGAGFEWQHDAQLQPDGSITVFDNATDGGPPSERQSRALRIRLKFKRGRARLVHAFTNHPAVLATSQGSVQPLGDGNTFVGWGATPYIAEYDSRGAEVFTLRFGAPVRTYRALRSQWWGQPNTLPSIAAAATSGGTRVYASWNGATTVQSWNVLAGPNPTALTPVGQFAMSSFETNMWVPSTAPYFAVQALGSAGQVLGTSAVVNR